MSTRIGPKIKKIRELRNLTQEYVAENLEISQSYYNRIENDQATLSFKRLKQIAAVFNIDITTLLTFDGEHFLDKHSGSSFNPRSVVSWSVSKEERELYQKQIQHLNEEVSFLRNLVNKLSK